MRGRPICCSSVYLLALLALSLPALLLGEREPAADSCDLAAPPPAPEPADDCAPDGVDPRLLGVWHRFDALTEGDRMRFWFFHEGGFGLYRYGKVGLTNTHSFNYRVDGDTVELTFRKTGERHRLPFRLEEDGGRTWLSFDGDPREPGARYFHAPPVSAACTDMPWRSGPMDHGPEASGLLGNRLWGEETRYATGGMGFSIYQLQPQSIDGRGVGWHHRGDYDEWTTETLTYRQRGERLVFGFPLRHEEAVTGFAVTRDGDERRLRLDDDPRDFWRPHTYRDMGPSFACLPR
jgi:hypothetical protein